MKIVDDHVEFAVVARMRKSLNDNHKPYEVTATYAYFSSIITWVTQRLRTDLSKDDSVAAQAASNLWKKMALEPIIGPPWNIKLYPKPDDGLISFPDGWHEDHSFEHHTADRFIKNLRNAVAHGDARKIQPFHLGRKGTAKRTLVGFTFLCSDGQITLRHTDMVHVANLLADRFCDAIIEASKWCHLEEDGNTGLSEAA